MSKPARPLYPLRDLLGEVAGRLGVDRAREAGELWSHWRAIVGDVVADHAEPISLRRGTLSIGVATPAWATEIGYLADEIKRRVNRALGDDVVREIRLRTGPMPSRERGPNRSRDASDALPPQVPEALVDGNPIDPAGALERARRAWSRNRSKRS